MHLSPFVRVSVKAGLVSLSTISQYQSLTLIGASCMSGLKPVSHDLTSIMLSPAPGKDALVALELISKGSKGVINKSEHLICMHWKGDKIIVDLDNVFQSPVGRIGQIDTCGNLIVVSHGQRFAMPYAGWHFMTEFEMALATDLQGQGFRIIQDPRYLLQYLLGEVNADFLEAMASTEDGRTPAEKELAHVKAAMQKLSADHQAELAIGLRVQDQLRKQTVSDQKLIGELDQERKDALAQARLLGQDLQEERELNHSVSRALRNVGDQKTFWGWFSRSKVLKIRALFRP